MTYKTPDGDVLTGTSPTDIVTALRDGGRFTVTQSLEEYMDAFVFRYTEWNGAGTIRCDTPDHFVADLVRDGYLTNVPD